MFWRVTKKEAAARRSSKMESRDHSNAANPKSLMSRGKIIKISLFFVTAIFTIGNTHAQTTFGLRGGMTATHIYAEIVDETVEGETQDATSFIGYQAGGLVEIGRVFSVQTGLYISSQGYRLMIEGERFKDRTVERFSLTYIQVPIHLQYAIFIYDHASVMWLKAGPYFGYAVGGKIIRKQIKKSKTIEKETEKMKIGTSTKDHYNATDMGVSLGIEFGNAKYRMGYFCNIGLKNISNNSSIFERNISIGITVTRMIW